MESKAQEARTAYLGQLSDLAQGYEDTGAGDRAQEILQQLLRLNPDDDRVKARLKDLQERVFKDKQTEFEVDSTKGWVVTGVRVSKGQAIRLESDGSYKFIVNTDIGPDGFPVENVMQDMGKGINAGALMGVIIADPMQRGRAGQPGEPFQIGRELEFKPNADGVLFVRLNVPPGSRCIGKIKLRISGNIAPATGG